MRIGIPPTVATAVDKRFWQNFPQNFPKNFPWSKITLAFFMISSFLIFATLGANGAETGTVWSQQMGEIIVGTTIFSLATILLVWAGRMIPKNL